MAVHRSGNHPSKNILTHLGNLGNLGSMSDLKRIVTQIDADLNRKVKAEAALRGIDKYVAVEEALRLWLKNGKVTK